MFSRILIANRGEIACRVISTAQRLGVETIAVHSYADARARHVLLATEAVHVGPSPAGESYLAIERIVDAALRCGAEAIHPGYGFLSENPDFVEAVEAAGLVFIGPSAASVSAMGLKDAAKDLMAGSGVPVVPGYHGGNQDSKHLALEAGRIGFPVMIKARAGGGGRGMRLVEDPADFADALASAQREAAAGFGDSAVLVEKCIRRPRHVEVQVFGDRQGNIVHLFERDCSLQRRHQKVIEEAPAPGMPGKVRAAMGAAAVKAARAVDYVGAGTVEFIADGSEGLKEDRFWFMEMNTRLQVEHPVTEAITGLNLVELQLRVAAGETLPFGQSDIEISGHAIEARICAEDATKGFLPATGQLRHLAYPDGVEFMNGSVRIDSGVRCGDAISPHYDSMIAKLIVHGPNRTAALAKLRRALADTRMAGLATNLEFLSRLAAHEGFCSGEVDTDLIGRNFDQLVEMRAPTPRNVGLAALSALGLISRPGSSEAWERLIGWRHWPTEPLPVSLEHLGTVLEVAVECLGNETFRVTCDAGTIDLSVEVADGNCVRICADGRTTTFDLIANGCDLLIHDGVGTQVFGIPDAQAAVAAADATGDSVPAPLPGVVKLAKVSVGQTVLAGDILLVLETMKMEHPIIAPRDGIISAVHAVEGDQVEEGMPLVDFEPQDR